MPEQTSVPVLSLLMLVKNEAKTIKATLESALPFIDGWVIVDTDSTDGTQDIIRETLKDIPGHLYDRPFINFGESYNEVLNLAVGKTKYGIFLHGDEYLHGDPQLVRDFCSKCDAGSVDVRMIHGDLQYFNPRLTRPDQPFRYVGATHEYLGGPSMPHKAMPDPVFHIQHEDSEPKNKVEQWKKDLVLLSPGFAANEPRATFYYGQSLECLGQYGEAVEAYSKRMKLGGWYEEVFEAALRKARCNDRIAVGSKIFGEVFGELVQQYLTAYSLNTRRAEPLYYVAKIYQRLGNKKLTNLFITMAALLPYPENDRLFVRADIYQTKIKEVLQWSLQ